MSSRAGIYYWKCDRPAAFHGTSGSSPDDEKAMSAQLESILRSWFKDPTVEISPACGQGNHRTFLTDIQGQPAFIRVEDGPERDDYFDVEGIILDKVRALGVPSPLHLGSDTSRLEAPFSWQILQRIHAKDLNHYLKEGTLPLEEIAAQIGALVARWQEIHPAGFGPFKASAAREGNSLEGLYASYPEYFFLNLDRHVQFLKDRAFLDQESAAKILATVQAHASLLQLESGCLVHKDLALWNILGTPSEILAVIDWDDAISGDPMDDLSLLGCFYDGKVLASALAGYESIRPLPPHYKLRFWLHLLRNMLVKAVIRAGAGYFDKKADFFLIGPGGSGEDLRTFTLRRIKEALQGLELEKDPREL